MHPLIQIFVSEPSGCMKADILHKAIHLLCQKAVLVGGMVRIADCSHLFKDAIPSVSSWLQPFLASVDSHNRCLQCLGIQHAEAAFVDGSCLYCECITIAMLRSRLTFLKGKGADPSATNCPDFSELHGHSPGGDFALQATKVTAWSLGKNNSGSTWSR